MLKTLSLLSWVQKVAVFLHPRGIEVVTYAANGNNKMIVVHVAFRQDSMAWFIIQCSKSDGFSFLINIIKFPQLKVVMMLSSMRRVHHTI